jgi:hypothetical protein
LDAKLKKRDAKVEKWNPITEVWNPKPWHIDALLRLFSSVNQKLAKKMGFSFPRPAYRQSPGGMKEFSRSVKRSETTGY